MSNLPKFKTEIINRFLLLPKKLPHANGKSQWKWLCWTDIERLVDADSGHWQEVAWSIVSAKLPLTPSQKALSLRGLQVLAKLVKGWATKKIHVYEYPRPALTTDFAVFTDANEVLLVKRKNPPFQGWWALPGGYLDAGETVKVGALRELKEETGLDATDVTVYDSPLLSDKPDRDPRDRVITFSFAGVAKPSAKSKAVAADDAAEVMWANVNLLSGLKVAFDHANIIRQSLRLVRGTT